MASTHLDRRRSPSRQRAAALQRQQVATRHRWHRRAGTFAQRIIEEAVEPVSSPEKRYGSTEAFDEDKWKRGRRRKDRSTARDVGSSVPVATGGNAVRAVGMSELDRTEGENLESTLVRGNSYSPIE